MKSLDTNVLARFFVDDPDDEEATRQRPTAIAAMAEPALVTVTVLLELEWVMRGLYGLRREWHHHGCIIGDRPKCRVLCGEWNRSACTALKQSGILSRSAMRLRTQGTFGNGPLPSLSCSPAHRCCPSACRPDRARLRAPHRLPAPRRRPHRRCPRDAQRHRAAVPRRG